LRQCWRIEINFWIIELIMKMKLIAVATLAISVASVQAQYTTNTFSFTGASWNDDASLSGYFTIGYDLSGTPISLVSLDVTTGDGIFPGFNYIYNVLGQEDTVSFDVGYPFDATQSTGWPANELTVFSLDESRFLNLDWQGTDPTSLYVGDPEGLHSSEGVYSPDFMIRGLTTAGGSGGTGGTVEPTPEPGTLVLAGLAGASLIAFRRRK